MVAAERLVLRLEPRSLDLVTALPLLRRHRLHSAFLAVRASRGDHVSSVEEVSLAWRNHKKHIVIISAVTGTLRARSGRYIPVFVQTTRRKQCKNVTRRNLNLSHPAAEEPPFQHTTYHGKVLDVDGV